MESRATPGQTRRITITPVSTSNTLLVNGPPAEVEEVVDIIRKLDEESSGGMVEFHIYHVEKGNAVLRPLARLERLDHQERHHGSLAQPA